MRRLSKGNDLRLGIVLVVTGIIVLGHALLTSTNRRGRQADFTRSIRLIDDDEHDAVLAIINDAAQRYRGVIPDDCWHDPYFSAEYLAGEIAAGVRFFVYEVDHMLLGVMGAQDVDDVTLIRHAYVSPHLQRAGIGSKLLHVLLATTDKPVLVGTWADSRWAIAFYEKHGFACVNAEEKAQLLRRYWDIPERQVETSVVLVERRPQPPNT